MGRVFSFFGSVYYFCGQKGAHCCHSCCEWRWTIERTTMTADTYPSMVFSSSVPDMVFRGAGSEGVATVLRVIPAYGTQSTLLDETLYGTEGVVMVADLTELLAPYALEHESLTVECTCGDATVTTHVYYSRSALSGSPLDVFDSHFLTMADGGRITDAEGGEELRCRAQYTSGPGLVFTVRARVLSGVVPVSVTTQIVSTRHASDGVTSVYSADVSASAVADALGVGVSQLLSYTVVAGSRVQDYVVRSADGGEAVTLSFVNNFGVRELLTCRGTQRTEVKVERKSVRIGGRLKNYFVKSERVHTLNTGWLNDAMVAVAEDLLRSQEVHVVNGDGTDGDEVVITDSKAEWDNSDDGLTRFELTYKAADQSGAVVTLSAQEESRVVESVFGEEFG